MFRQQPQAYRLRLVPEAVGQRNIYKAIFSKTSQRCSYLTATHSIVACAAYCVAEMPEEGMEVAPREREITML